MHNVTPASVERPSFGAGDGPRGQRVFRQVRADSGARHLGTEEIVHTIFANVVEYPPTVHHLSARHRSGHCSFRLRNPSLNRLLRLRGKPSEIELPVGPDANLFQPS